MLGSHSAKCRLAVAILALIPVTRMATDYSPRCQFAILAEKEHGESVGAARATSQSANANAHVEGKERCKRSHSMGHASETRTMARMTAQKRLWSPSRSSCCHEPTQLPAESREES